MLKVGMVIYQANIITLCDAIHVINLIHGFLILQPILNKEMAHSVKKMAGPCKLLACLLMMMIIDLSHLTLKTIPDFL